MARITTNVLRIAWSTRPSNIALGIAAQCFVYAGVVLLFVLNLFFAQRIVRAQHPRFGWSKPFSIAFPVLFAIIILTIAGLITVLVQSFYSLNTNTHRIDRDFQLYGATFYAVVSFLPAPIVLISSAFRQIPPFRKHNVDKFGAGTMRGKIMVVCVSAVILSLGACFRAGTSWLPPTPLFVPGSNPQRAQAVPWYFSKPCFYVFNFVLELLVVYFWAAVRIDNRFHIPDGATGPGSYGGGFTFAGEAGNEKANLGQRDSTRHLTGSKSSFATSRRSRSRTRESVVSWGGISRPDLVEPGVGEDGVQTVPYPPAEDDDDWVPDEIGGLDNEMGWDAKSGRWMLRPLSNATYRHSLVQPMENV